MKIFSLRISVLTLASISLQITAALEQPIVVACNFDAINKNAETSEVVGQAMRNAKTTLTGMNWKILLKLSTNMGRIKQRGLELAATTPGTGNVVKKLFAELETQDYGHFSPINIRQLCVAGIQPLPDREAIAQTILIKELGIPALLVGSQDSLEYEIFEQKMKDVHHIDLKTIFEGVVTIPTLEELAKFNQTTLCLSRNEHWLVSRDPSPSESFISTVSTLAQRVKQNSKVLLVNDKVQLAAATQALKQSYRQPMAEGLIQLLEKSIAPSQAITQEIVNIGE